MKKIFFIISAILTAKAFCSTDFEEFKQDRNSCYKEATSQCILKLMNKYSASKKYYQNWLRYDYGVMLMHEESYPKAKSAFDSVLLHEKENEQLIKLTKQKQQEIQEIYKKMNTANNLDAGNYFNEAKTSAIWEKPYNIKVFIADKSAKATILKNAFIIWDEKMYKLINFSYVTNEQDADIICKYVDKFEGIEAGITKYGKIRTSGNKKYFTKVNIEVSLHNPGGGNYTDTNLLSIALHEVGHALGITYHSDNLNDIMYSTTASYKNTNISKRDINTLKRIYR